MAECFRRTMVVGIFFGLVGCSGSSDSVPSPDGQTPTTSPTQGPGNDPPPTNATTTPPAPDPPAPTVADKTFERAPGASVRGMLAAEGATNVTFEIATPPKLAKVALIDAAKGEFYFRPGSLTAVATDEFTYVAKANGKTSTPAKVSITVKPFDFTSAMEVRHTVEDWYSYNLSINFSNNGTSECGSQQASIANGKLLARSWGSCGTFPEIGINVGQASASATINGGGGDVRKITIARKQLDARIAWTESSTDCSSYNPTLNTCNAGLSENLTAGVYLGPAPTTTTAPVMQPSTCETTAGKSCDGYFLVTDAEADALSFDVTAQPQHGALTMVSEMRSFMYAPKPGFTGTDTFTVVANDSLEGVGGLSSQPTTITVVVK